MEAIEIIDYNDSGSEAIKKLDRNQRKIKNHLDTINVDGMQQQINDLNRKIEKQVFYCTANPGYTISKQDCFLLNGIAYYNVRVKKNDDTAFGIDQHNLFSCPYYNSTYPFPVLAAFSIGYLTSPVRYNGAIWIDSGCYITIADNIAKEIIIHAEVKVQ